jgi:hypothetical protein
LLGAVLLGVIAAPLLPAAGLSSYRGFHLGMSLSAAAQEAGMKPSEAVTVYQRPALIQTLAFQPNLFHSAAAAVDPVSEISLSFYNGQLFRVAALYDRYKVDGMTPDDMIEGISASYGKADKPAAEIAYHSYYAEVAPVLARWEDADDSYNLIRSEDRSSYALVLYSKQAEAVAQSAMLQAVKLDAQEAPQRDAARAKKQEEDDRAKQEQNRLSNKASFRP